MFAVAALALLATLALAVARAFLGPTVFDRVLAANTVGTVAMLLLAGAVGVYTPGSRASRPSASRCTAPKSPNFRAFPCATAHAPRFVQPA